jgi:hypothetical protein
VGNGEDFCIICLERESEHKGVSPGVENDFARKKIEGFEKERAKKMKWVLLFPVLRNGRKRLRRIRW